MAVRRLVPTDSGAIDASVLTPTAVVSVAVLRLRTPPLAPAGGPLSRPELRGIALPAGTAIGAGGNVTALIGVAGLARLWLSASLVTVTAADISLSAFPIEPTAQPGAIGLPPLLTQGPTLQGGSSRLLRQYDVAGLDVVQAQVVNTGAGATTGGLNWWGA
jgi:hypothetical protein